MSKSHIPAMFDALPTDLVEQLLTSDRRVLLFGQPGIGKTTLAAGLARQLMDSGRTTWCLSADPGSPAFGVPGAVCLGQWLQHGWQLQRTEALCTLDAARFRLPLISAVRRMAQEVTAGTLLLDAPGVVRGVAGAELLTTLVEAASIDLVLILRRSETSLALAHELDSLQAEVVYVQAADKAHRPGKMSRSRSRTELWERYLELSETLQITLDELQLLGTPPRHAPQAWQGKQVAFLQGDQTITMGEVVAADEETLHITLPTDKHPTNTLLVRDACRDEAGWLGTSKTFAADVARYIPPTDILPDSLIDRQGGLRPLVHTGTAIASLMNGIFGDPLLHLRLRHQRRSLLFDLGDGARLPARIAHQVTDVFISHTHMDHISGFLWLLRSRIGETSVCRLYGPPGLAANIQGLIAGIHWDRIGERGPVFEIAELDGNRLQRFHIKAGIPGCTRLSDTVISEGVLLDESDYCIRAVTLDHGTPVLAYAYEPANQINVRKERLDQRGLEPGPWLNELKQKMLNNELNASIRLPNGEAAEVASLADELTLVTPGNNIVYATDFADTLDNRAKVESLAQRAHTLFCEAPFLQQEAEQARRTGHLTTRACGEIAHNAKVQHLIPFHFSRRYEDRPWLVYEEIAAFCPQLVRPNQSQATVAD